MSEGRSVDHKIEGIEVDLVYILRKIVAIRKQLYKATAVGLVFGIIVGLSSGITSLAASFLGGGAGMGNSTDALNASLSSDIVSSTPFLLELLKMRIIDSGETQTLSNYLMTESSPWWSYIAGLPSLAVSGVKSLFIDKKEYSNEKLQNGVIRLTKKEKAQIDILKKSIIATIDKKTAITNVSVTLQNPRVAAVVADSVVRSLQEYIIGYRTSKAKEDCAYLEKLFEERKQEYYTAQKEYAEYVDSHDNLILQSVRAEQERLQNEMSLTYQVYSQVANQLQVARAKVQEEKPVFAVVEPAVIPLKTSGLGMKVYVLLFIFLSIFVMLGWVLFGKKIFDSLKR